MSRLADTDFANFALLETQIKLAKMRAHTRINVPHSLRPIRETFGEVVGAATSLFGHLERQSWNNIAELISAKSRKSIPSEEPTNLDVGKAIFDLFNNLQIEAVQYEFPVYSTKSVLTRHFWAPYLFRIDNKPFVAFFDPRKSGELSDLGRNFIYNVMHHAIREQDPALWDVDLAVIQCPADVTGLRRGKIRFFGNSEVIELDEIERLAVETLNMWQQVLEERKIMDIGQDRKRGRGLF